MTLDQAMQSGFCIISRHHRIAARLDRPDWREVMHERYPRLLESLASVGTAAAHQYRGCFATGRIDVPAEWLDVMPHSLQGPDEYRAMVSEDGEGSGTAVSDCLQSASSEALA